MLLWPGKNKMNRFVQLRMATMKMNTPKKSKVESLNHIINPNVRDYGNDPFVVEKANESKRVLEKYGFPKELQGRIKK
jgi:hypothetical protein